MKQSKHASPHYRDHAFSLDVSNRIRHLSGERKVASANRKNTFLDRDEASGEMDDCEQGTTEYNEASIRFSEAIRKILKLDVDIKWCDAELEKIIGDTEKLEADPRLIDVDALKPPKEAYVHKRKKEGGDVEGQATMGDAPVGRRKKFVQNEADDGVAQGVNEHLKASVNELDITAIAKEKCVEVGLTTVGEIKLVMDSDPTWGGLAGKVGTGFGNAVGQAVKAFLSKHTRAIETEFKGGKTSDGVVKPPKGTRVGRGAGKKG